MVPCPVAPLCPPARQLSAVLLCLLATVALPFAAGPAAAQSSAKTTISATATTAHVPAQPGDQAPVPVREVALEGVSVFGRGQLLRALDVQIGRPLPAAPADLARQLEARYQRDGYTAARANVTFNEVSGSLLIQVAEGRIDAIEFDGVDKSVAARLAGEFAIQPGDIFNTRETGHALDVLLAQTRGAIEAISHLPPGTVFHDSRDLAHASRPYSLVDRNGRRVLTINLGTRSGRFKVSFGAEGREDWFSPVDGFSPALGFNAVVFDQGRFNHTFLSGYASYKFSADRWGYTLGGERPFLAGPRLFVGASVFDITGSDDLWRLSPTEQSLVSAGFADSYRDYYGRTGYQANATLRIARQHEVEAAWRDEQETALGNQTDWSLFRQDEQFPPNGPAAGGRLHALLFAYAWDSRGFEQESLHETYLRHTLDRVYGTTAGHAPGWRLEWTTEVARPAMGGDFDFSRHIVNARRYTRLSPHQELATRLLLGIAEGSPPPQRLFALGGIGSIRGYPFKQSIGERMFLANVEYRLHLGDQVYALAFVDTGRVSHPVPGSLEGWMTGLGGGVGWDSFRVEVGWPTSLAAGHAPQVLVRLQPTF